MHAKEKHGGKAVVGRILWKCSELVRANHGRQRKAAPKIKIEKPKISEESTVQRTEAIAHSLRTYFIHGLIKSDRVVDKNLSTSESSVPGAE